MLIIGSQSGYGAPAALLSIGTPVGRHESPDSVPETAAKLAEAARQKQQSRRDLLDPSRISLQISVHKATGRYVVRVINDVTGEIIREVPPEHVLNAIVQILESSGMKIDLRA